MTAAELLRDLASVNEMCAEEREALHALLPLLAGLVEAVGAHLKTGVASAAGWDAIPDEYLMPEGRALCAVARAYAALEAAAAKEGV